MRYIAKSAGFRNGRRIREGDRFDGPEGLKGKWFEPAEKLADKPTAGKEPAEKLADKGPETFSEMTKRDAKSQEPKGAEGLV